MTDTMMTEARYLCIVPATNRPGKKDVTGAFLPKSKELLYEYAASQSVLVTFDNEAPLAERRVFVDERIRDFFAAGPGRVAFFCHGTTKTLQTGHNLLNLPPIPALGCDRVMLYACLAGADSRGFAAKLSESGIEVFAHRKSGHATLNPQISLWKNGVGDAFYPSRGSREWLADGGDIDLAFVKSLAGSLVRYGKFSFKPAE